MTRPLLSRMYPNDSSAQSAAYYRHPCGQQMLSFGNRSPIATRPRIDSRRHSHARHLDEVRKRPWLPGQHHAATHRRLGDVLAIRWRRLVAAGTGCDWQLCELHVAPARPDAQYPPVLRLGGIARRSGHRLPGGEYSNAGSPDGSSTQNETNRCEMHHPVINVWRMITPPAGWPNMGDAPCTLLPDGRLLVGYYNGMKTALYDPAARWTAGPIKGRPRRKRPGPCSATRRCSRCNVRIRYFPGSPCSASVAGSPPGGCRSSWSRRRRWRSGPGA